MRKPSPSFSVFIVVLLMDSSNVLLCASTFFNNESVTGVRKPCSISCSYVKNFGMLRHSYSSLLEKHNVGAVKDYYKVNGNHPSCSGLFSSMPKGRFTPYKQTSLVTRRTSQIRSTISSDGSGSGERITMDEQTLERDLQIAIAEENYTKAAKIRDNLKALQEDSKTLVLMANSRFYDAFRTGDLAAMQVLWARGDNVCCVHPGVQGIAGYDDVMMSWEYVWANYEFPLEIQTKDVRVHARGDVGYITCLELVKTKGSSWGGQFVTNVFERIDGQWFICIHHATYVDL